MNIKIVSLLLFCVAFNFLCKPSAEDKHTAAFYTKLIGKKYVACVGPSSVSIFDRKMNFKSSISLNGYGPWQRQKYRWIAGAAFSSETMLTVANAAAFLVYIDLDKRLISACQQIEVKGRGNRKLRSLCYEGPKLVLNFR